MHNKKGGYLPRLLMCTALILLIQVVSARQETAVITGTGDIDYHHVNTTSVYSSSFYTHPNPKVESFIRSGAIGYPIMGDAFPDGTFVARGDNLAQGRIIMDPSHPRAGLVLSNKALAVMSKAAKRYPNVEPFELAVRSVIIVHNTFETHSKNRQKQLIENHVAIQDKETEFISVTLNELTGAIYASTTENAAQQGIVLLGVVSNTTLQAVNTQGADGTEQLLHIHPSQNIRVPIAELLSVGGFYFRDSISPLTAFTQKRDTFRTMESLYGYGLQQTQYTIPKSTRKTHLYYTEIPQYLDRRYGDGVGDDIFNHTRTDYYHPIRKYN